MTHPTAPRRVWLQLGFGLGHAFLQAWRDWRLDLDHLERLDFIASTTTPPDAAALRAAHRGTALEALSDALAATWPPRTRNLHRLSFDGAQVHLLLAVGAAIDVLPELQAQVDQFLIDELDLSADPQRAPTRLCKGRARLAAPMARLRAAPTQQLLRPALVSAGFEVEPGQDEIHAVYRPGFVPRRRSISAPGAAERHVLIVGAGLAGCATAAALAEQGWSSTLIDRADAPAREGSGNPAGLFHGSVNPQDGAHARFNRAAALAAQRAVQQAIDSGMAQGSTQGLLRLETGGKEAAQMRADLQALQLPGDYVQALDAKQAGGRCGLVLQHPAWFYPRGGWVQPAALARWFLQQAGAAATFRGGQSVQSLRPVDGRWQLLDARGSVIAEAVTVVLANAFDALRLLQVTHWPVQSVRGQISLCPATQLRLPQLPAARHRRPGGVRRQQPAGRCRPSGARCRPPLQPAAAGPAEHTAPARH
jgi:tRNA 5-methylaminomethyl-2-thiouridine biosynthesis bifunctional protein